MPYVQQAKEITLCKNKCAGAAPVPVLKVNIMKEKQKLLFELTRRAFIEKYGVAFTKLSEKQQADLICSKLLSEMKRKARE